MENCLGCGPADILFPNIQQRCIPADTRGHPFFKHLARYILRGQGRRGQRGLYVFCPRTVADSCGQFADTSENHAVSRLPVGKPAMFPSSSAASQLLPRTSRSRGLCACFEAARAILPDASPKLPTFQIEIIRNVNSILADQFIYPAMQILRSQSTSTVAKSCSACFERVSAKLGRFCNPRKTHEMRPLVLTLCCSFSKKSFEPPKCCGDRREDISKRHTCTCIFGHMRKKVLKT